MTVRKTARQMTLTSTNEVENLSESAQHLYVSTIGTILEL